MGSCGREGRRDGEVGDGLAEPRLCDDAKTAPSPRRTRRRCCEGTPPAQGRILQQRCEGRCFPTIESNTTYTDQDFSFCELPEGELRASQFIRCRFRSARLKELVTHGCTFADCDFTGAQMHASSHTNSAFLNGLFRSANLFTARFTECKMTGSGFEEANLTGLLISGGDWSYVNLRGHSLARLDLRGVKFREADLYRCNLERCDLRKADLHRAVLTQAKLAGADLRGAEVEGVDFTGFDLHRVKLDFGQAVAVARAYGAQVDA